MKLIEQSFGEDRCILDLEAKTLAGATEQITARLAERQLLSNEQAVEVTELLLKREKLAATAIGQAVAVPHAYSDALTEPCVVFARLDHPINCGAMDGVPVSYIFILIGPKTQPDVISIPWPASLGS